MPSAEGGFRVPSEDPQQKRMLDGAGPPEGAQHGSAIDECAPQHGGVERPVRQDGRKAHGPGPSVGVVKGARSWARKPFGHPGLPIPSRPTSCALGR